MSFHQTFKTTLAVTTLVGSLALPGAAFALDADDFATKLASIVSQGGAKMSFSSVEIDGDTIVLEAVRLNVPQNPALEIGDIAFSGVEETDDGGYHVARADFDDVSIADGPGTLSIVDLQMDELTIPADSSFETLDDILFYKGFSTGKISVEKRGAEIFSMAGVSLEMDRADDNSSFDVTMLGSDMLIDVSMVEDRKAKQALADLGYSKLSGDLLVEGGWEAEDGILSISEYSLAFDDVGKIAMSFQISGYTFELMKAMQEAQAAAAANPDRQAGQQAMGMVMLGLAQQLSFNWASIGFEDASLTERALGYAGKQQGMSGDQMRQAMKGMLPLMLGQLGIPALQQQIAEAANVYLDNPGNIVVTARPADPVGMPMIMGAGMGDPRSLVDLLNVQVTANQPELLCCE